MSTNGRTNDGMPNVAASVSSLTNDVIELTELQTQLFMLDIKKSSQKTRLCIILTVVGICLLLATIPVGLIALAELFNEQLEWSRAGSYGMATLIGLVLTATVLGAAWSQIKSGLVSLERSRAELNRNIAWIKSTLRSRGQHQTSDRPLAL